MKLSQALEHYNLIVENGPLATRLKYEHGYVAVHDLYADIEASKILMDLYKGDIYVAHNQDTPIIINAATFRASRNHLVCSGMNDYKQIEQINLGNLQLIMDLRIELKGGIPIFLGAPLGSMFDAYSIKNIPKIKEAYEYHKEQMALLNFKWVNKLGSVY